MMQARRMQDSMNCKPHTASQTRPLKVEACLPVLGEVSVSPRCLMSEKARLHCRQESCDVASQRLITMHQDV